MSFTLPSDDELRRLFSLLDEKDIAEMTEQFDADVAYARHTESKHEESVNKKMKHINETKRDVFNGLLEDLAYAYIDLDGEGIGEELTNEDKQAYLKDYDAALPGDLPVIPEAWGDTIEEFKANHYRLSEIFTEWDWNYDEQELIARAWVLGVWRVEETGEIVKLEAEK